jgi:hypothetical protein
MTAQPERNVESNILTSTAQPVIKLRIADDLRFLGRVKFLLYGVADVDLFVFVSAPTGKQVDRIFLVQFEGYLDTNTHTYTYSAAHTVALNGHEYIHDTFAYPSAAMFRNPESDSAQTMNFILEHGYTLPTDFISARFVRLLDNDRKEILFSFVEDLSNFGHTSAEIAHDSRLLPAFSTVENQVLEHALRAFEVIEG